MKRKEGDGMYILYSGAVTIFPEGQEQTESDIYLPAPKVIGETALESKVVRNADIEASTEVKMLFIST